MRMKINSPGDNIEHTPVQLAQAMAGYRFSMKALLAQMFRESANGLGRESIARRAEETSLKVIQDFRNESAEIPVYFDENTEPFPLVTEVGEGIWVEFSPEPSPHLQPRPAIAPWGESLGEKKMEEVPKNQAAEDDVFAGLDSLDDFMVDTSASAEEALTSVGDMRIMSEPVEPEETVPMPVEELEQLREMAERTATIPMAPGSTPSIDVRYPESLGEAVALLAETAGFTDRISMTLEKKVPECTPTLLSPLEIDQNIFDQELFDQCFPPKDEDKSY